LLTGYKKLLEQVNVIDSKLSLVKRLKDISNDAYARLTMDTQSTKASIQRS